MDPATIDYIIDYFGRLMSEKEARAWKHYTTTTSIRSLRENEEGRKNFIEKGWLTGDAEVLALLEDGWLLFRERTAERIMVENSDQIFFNNCPRCGKLARTPFAKQCRYCSYNWHRSVSATFHAEAAFKVLGRGCYIVGDILSGRIRMGMKVDLVPLHIPRQVEITEVTMGRRVNGKQDIVGLGLKSLSEKELQLLKNQSPFKAILNIERKYKLSYMGMFLSMAGVIGKPQEQVVASLGRYAQSVGGGLENAELSVDDDNFCAVAEQDNNTTVLYPYWLMDWDEVSLFLSKDLQAPVFSFHIHDGDLWMYVLFVNGKTVDRFNPIPEYWDDSIGEEEKSQWRGNASTVAKYVHQVKVADIERYLVHWDSDEDTKKAYPDDEYENEDWQLLDFMRKLGLPYPLTGDREPVGKVYNFWQKQPDQNSAAEPNPAGSKNKPWWKFW